MLEWSKPTVASYSPKGKEETDETDCHDSTQLKPESVSSVPHKTCPIQFKTTSVVTLEK